MRRKLLEGLARAARRAALVSGLGFVLAIATGVGGYALTSANGRGGILIAAATPRLAPPEVTALAAVPRRGFVEDAVVRADTVVPLRDLAVPLSRESEGRASPSGDREPASGALLDRTSPATQIVVAAASFARGPVELAGTPITPSLAPGDRIGVPVSFYYCNSGTKTAAQGDGGGFCGAMRDGSIVYNGAAACDHKYMGQRFKILGDPLPRVYKCADTGSAVHGLHRDIWFGSSDEGWSWQLSVGQAAWIEILP
ncbi:MAG: hypothetical protein EXR64_04545 [Dehalococcoidia bacterium]|nr:hypothetical protein [Dehalococcoidia bacterium]